MTSLCVATSYTADFSSVGDCAAAAVRAYAALHDATPYVEDALVFAERPAPWHRVRLIPELFARGADCVLWIDADATFLRYDVDIRSVLRPGKDLYLVQHRVGDSIIPNTGVMVLRNTPWTLDLLDRLWRLDRYTHHIWWENAAMIDLMGYYRLLGGHIDIPNRAVLDRVEFLPLEWNSLAPGCMARDPIIIHYAGQSRADRDRELPKHAARGLLVAQACLAQRRGQEGGKPASA